MKIRSDFYWTEHGIQKQLIGIYKPLSWDDVMNEFKSRTDIGIGSDANITVYASYDERKKIDIVAMVNTSQKDKVLVENSIFMRIMDAIKCLRTNVGVDNSIDPIIARIFIIDEAFDNIDFMETADIDNRYRFFANLYSRFGIGYTTHQFEFRVEAFVKNINVKLNINKHGKIFDDYYVESFMREKDCSEYIAICHIAADIIESYASFIDYSKGMLAKYENR